ncbi:MAG TPA: L,D-transpeptidase family protein [Panacibacter sp.]|nr:L,D-transpeptidase family protein [Panacibacter sp.]HNP44733.1 L,D-transpeptidase family protein [Panacibacter sp.]
MIIPLLLAILCACTSGNNYDVNRDTSVNSLTSFNNLFLDSSKLEQFLGEHPEYRSYEEQFIAFYKQRNYEFAWFDSTGLGEQAGNFINLLNENMTNLGDSSMNNSAMLKLYNEFADNGIRNHNSIELVNTELMLTGGFFKYAAKVYNGTDSSITDLGWFIPRKKVDLTAVLDSVVINKQLKNSHNLLNDQYERLASFLPFYYNLEKQGNWDSIEKPLKPVHFLERSPIVIKVKDRLKRLGYLPKNDSTPLLDSGLFKALKVYQKRMGLSVDGAIGPKLIEEINVTPAGRVKQILVNLERMRWMPVEEASKHIFVNIPDYKMYVYDSGKISFSMNVIVGTTANSTVIFSGDLKYIVFSPYWKVPVKIVRTEIVPGIKKDPNYLAKHDMERLGGSDTLPSIRQKPGPSNSLGKVKFLFPNNYDIYFHDTPNRELFSASSRSFSHGCIRVGEPKKLAQFLLRSDTLWTSYRIDTAMNNTKETWVSLPKTVPVMIAYFTAFVDDKGELNFRKDIYGHDAKLAGKLFVSR